MNPLNINSDPENRNQRIETLIIPSRFCSDDSVTGSGGRAIIVLPSRGNLSGDSRILVDRASHFSCWRHNSVPSRPWTKALRTAIFVKTS